MNLGKSLELDKLGWYARRLGRMSPSEVRWRVVDKARQQHWRRYQGGDGGPDAATPDGSPKFDALLPAPAGILVPPAAADAVLTAADELLKGRWHVLGVTRDDMDAPDWFFDPITGRRAPQHRYCFAIDHRSEAVTGNVKQVWEVARLQHVTLLASAYALSESDAYAEAAARQLSSWWDANPVLSGVHWTSGIELGIRLISWVWARRLLDGWSGAAELFERNERALTQIWWHQNYLAAFRSRGSSANNHVIAEAAGQLVAALAFPWFAESRQWADTAAALLQEEMGRNTFPSGVNREMAFEYHGFVAELGLVAAVEADRAGRPIDDATKDLLCRMLDVVAASLDEQLRPPRQGDGDDGRGFLLGPPADNRWVTLLAIGRELFGAPGWWPPSPPDAASSLIASLGKQNRVANRPSTRPSSYPDAGLTILRTAPGDGPEIWCRCDGGPHGFQSIAAHAHADALSVEVRHGGVDILADPATYCYHGEDRWRTYFRSTLGHNTIELGGVDQSASGGHFLWTRHARTLVIEAENALSGDILSWCAEQDGYAALDPPGRHRRTVRLVQTSRRLEICDEIETTQVYRIAFHFGPSVHAELHDGSVRLSWPVAGGSRAHGQLALPEQPSWSLVRGSTDPVLGWYSAHFGEKDPSTTLLGEGRGSGHDRLLTILQFDS
jgi:hypothetical protein